MGKSKKEKTVPKKTKKIKSNRKEMFSELKTFEENKIHHHPPSHHHNIHSPIHHEPNSSQQYMIPELPEQQDQLLNFNNTSKEWELVHHLLAKNKINQKNAFNFELISVADMPEFTSIQPSDNAWKKMSSTLQNEYKIYSYKIDAIHTIAYRILNTMNRSQENNEEAVNEKKDSPSELPDYFINFPGEKNEVSTTQLQKNIKNINIEGIEYACSFNPKFERTKRKFNQCGFGGLLLNNIEIDPNLELSLDGKRLSHSVHAKNPINVRVDQMKQPLLIPRQIEKISRQSYRLIREEYRGGNESIEEIWRNIGYGIWQDMQKQQHNPMEEQIYLEEENMRKVEDVVKVSKKKNGKTKFEDYSEIIKDGSNWMSEYDKKILGLGGPSTVKKSCQVVKNEDDIQFTLDYIDKEEILNQQTIDRFKNQFFEEIEEKHLLPLRMPQKFKVQQIMSLRKEPVEVLMREGEIQFVDDYQERMQIDVKRQQMSIRQTKEKLKGLLKKQKSFGELYGKFEKQENEISPSLCFLTILHLANENSLQLQQKNDFNFTIK